MAIRRSVLGCVVALAAAAAAVALPRSVAVCTVMRASLFRTIRRPLRLAPLMCAAADNDGDGLGDDADVGDGGLIPARDMAMLSRRIARIQQTGLATPAQKLFEIATAKPPQAVMGEFFAEAPVTVVEAMRDAIVSLLGALPSLQFDTVMTTTGDRLAALMLQLQMTGYMLRNAQYVISLRSLLSIDAAGGIDAFRAAFDRLDTDGSGYIEAEEVQTLLRDVYGDDPPPYEAVSFMGFFDANSDGRISWTEFLEALGAPESARDAPLGEAAALPIANGDAAAPAPSTQLSGKVKVSLDGGQEIEVDAEEYMAELRQEAERLRKELNSLQELEAKKELAVTSSLSAYISSLPEKQLKVLTRGISQDVLTAMNMVVKYILKLPDDEGSRDMSRKMQVKLDEKRLQQLCMYQLVLGYRLREAEAKGEAQEQLGL